MSERLEDISYLKSKLLELESESKEIIKSFDLFKQKEKNKFDEKLKEAGLYDDLQDKERALEEKANESNEALKKISDEAKKFALILSFLEEKESGE